MIVGPDRKVFSLHKRLLCENSEYFKAALEGSFKEATTQSIELLDDKVEIFKVFQHWLYTGTLTPSLIVPEKEPNQGKTSESAKESKSNPETPSAKADERSNRDGTAANYALDEDQRWDLLCDLFIFVDKRRILAMHNIIIESLSSWMHHLNKTPVRLISHIYDSTPEGSGLRQLFVNEMVRFAPGGVHWFSEGNKPYYTRDFLLDVVQAQFEIGSRAGKSYKELLPDSTKGCYI